MIFNPFWITLTELLVVPGTSSTSPVSAPDIYIYILRIAIGFSQFQYAYFPFRVWDNFLLLHCFIRSYDLSEFLVGDFILKPGGSQDRDNERFHIFNCFIQWLVEYDLFWIDGKASIWLEYSERFMVFHCSLWYFVLNLWYWFFHCYIFGEIRGQIGDMCNLTFMVLGPSFDPRINSS